MDASRLSGSDDFGVVQYIHWHAAYMSSLICGVFCPCANSVGLTLAFAGLALGCAGKPEREMNFHSRFQRHHTRRNRFIDGRNPQIMLDTH